MKKFYCTLTKSNVYGYNREEEDQKFGTHEFVIMAENHGAASARFEQSAASRDIPATAEKQILNDAEDDARAWSCCYIQYETENNRNRTIWYLDIHEAK